MVDDRGWRPHAEGDVEQDIPRGGLAATQSCPHNDPANLLIAWAHEAQLSGDCTNTPVRFRNRCHLSVEALCRSDEAQVDSRRELEHAHMVRTRNQRRLREMKRK